MLVEPVALSDFFLSFFSAAMIILTATMYAGLFAWGRISGRRAAYIGALLSYTGLLACVGVFSLVNNFTGYWLLLSLIMLIGYAFMPYAIWRLCVATHTDETDH